MIPHLVFLQLAGTQDVVLAIGSGEGAALALGVAGLVGAVVGVAWTVVVGWQLLGAFLRGSDDVD